MSEAGEKVWKYFDEGANSATTFEILKYSSKLYSYQQLRANSSKKSCRK
jgi:hypothetical protein